MTAAAAGRKPSVAPLPAPGDSVQRARDWRRSAILLTAMFDRVAPPSAREKLRLEQLHARIDRRR
jgi:hypothetical protein